MDKRFLLVLFIFLSVALFVFAYFKFNYTYAQAQDTESIEFEQSVKDRLDSILENQTTILKRLDDVDREVKNRCKQ